MGRYNHLLSNARGNARALCVTPVFPKKTKCKPICMPGSNFIHIVTYKWITVQYHVRKRKSITLKSWKRRLQTLQAVDWGLCTPRTQQHLRSIFIVVFLFLSNIVYSNGEHLSYSASVGKGWMQRLYSGLGYKHLAF
jgi:hypothetical protein